MVFWFAAAMVLLGLLLLGLGFFMDVMEANRKKCARQKREPYI